MRRRAVIAGAAAAMTPPTVARGQAGTPPIVGFLRSTGPAGYDELVAAFRKGLAESGFVEGRDVAIEFRWADNHMDRLPGLAAELVRRPVAAIVVHGGSAPAAMAATATIPIVFVTGADPLRADLVRSLSRPGGNVTGVAFATSDLSAKRLGMLHDLIPRLDVIAVLADRNAIENAYELSDAEEAGRAIGRRLLIVKAANEPEFNAAFEGIVRAGARAVLVLGGAYFSSQRRIIVALAARHALPASYVTRDYVESGGLMSYGPSQPDAYRRAGIYVARILRGAKPADLPVELPTKYELVINQRAAKAIGFEVPASLLLIADEVIE